MLTNPNLNYHLRYLIQVAVMIVSILIAVSMRYYYYHHLTIV